MIFALGCGARAALRIVEVVIVSLSLRKVYTIWHHRLAAVVITKENAQTPVYITAKTSFSK